MVKLFTQPFDFVSFNLYFAVGFFDIFYVPRCAFKYGGASFLGLYLGVVLLLGIPAFAEESAYLMADDSRNKSPKFRKWLRFYELISLVQITQLGVSEAHSKLLLAVTQFFNMVDPHRPEMMPLFSENCRISSSGSLQDLLLNDSSAISLPASVITISDAEDDYDKLEKQLLQPTCLRRTRSEVACLIHALFSEPGNSLYYMLWMLSLVILAYAMIFGRAMASYGAIGRVYMSLIVLCIFTLLLHFVGKPLTPDFKLVDFNLIDSFETSLTHALMYSGQSLGIMGFSISIIGSRAGPRVKKNFVAIAALVCLIDTLVGSIFTGLNYLRHAAVESLCNNGRPGARINTEHFMEMPDMTPALMNYSRFEFEELALRGALQVSESVLMFRETSGSVPWTVYLPFQVLFMLVSFLLTCACLILSDLQALRVLNRRPQLAIVLVVLRFAATISMSMLSLNSQLRHLKNYMWVSVQLAFPIVKIFDCISIHRCQGFAEFLEDRRRLLSRRNTVQRMLYNWYIAPVSVFLYHFGYPTMLLILTQYYYSTVVSFNFYLYFASFNILPAVLIVLKLYFYD